MTGGNYGYVAGGNGLRPVFVIVAQPHIMMKLKRVIPQAKQQRDGSLEITATKELARDLEWFFERYPLQPLTGEAQAQLTKLADAHRSGQEQIARILEGEIVDYGTREPALTPREYQLLPRAMVRAQGFLFLGDDVGLGKTFASSLIFTESSALRGLVVAPTHLVGQWADELRLYYPWLRTHKIRQGSPYGAKQFRLLDELDRADVILTNYHKLAGWGDYLQGKITTVIFDEAHELRTGAGTGKYTAAAMVARTAKYRIGLSATPVYNYGDEIHHVISILDPHVLGTEDEFTREWGGKRIADPRALGTYLRESGIMLRRNRKEVGRELPAVSSMVQPVETDHATLQRMVEQGIVAMAAKVLDDATDREERWALSGQLEMKVRHATGVAKAPYVAEFVKMLLTREKKIVLVGHHHDVYECWMKALAEYNPVMYSGKQSDNQKRESIRQFVEGDARVFIMGLRVGAGLNGLQKASSTMVLGELDWSPAQHHQIIGRLNRDGQADPVAVFYMLSDGGSDPPMAELLELKRRIAEPINDPDADIVAPSPQEAMRRVQALAKDLLRQHGVNPKVAPPATPVPMPAPVPGSGELISVDALTDRAVAAAATRAAQTRILEGRTYPAGDCGLCGRAMYRVGQVPTGGDPNLEDCGGDCRGCVRDAEGQAPLPAPRPASRDALRGRLTGARR